jgi:hypothetical protein
LGRVLFLIFLDGNHLVQGVLFLIQLQGQAIGVMEEHEAAVGRGVYPDGFMLDTHLFQFFNFGENIVDFKG